MGLLLSLDSISGLHVRTFITEFPAPLGSGGGPAWLLALHGVEAEKVPLTRPAELRAAVRDLLRQGGHKPTGRGKPSSEYLLRAAAEGGLPSINTAVDACNAVSFHSGLPISVVDLDKARAPFRIGIPAPGAEYVFNPSGQTIALKGLLCLFDAEGPCANAVKDAQRTKTDAGTTRTLSVIWGPLAFAEQVDRSSAWYRELLQRAGARTETVDPQPA